MSAKDGVSRVYTEQVEQLLLHPRASARIIGRRAFGVLGRQHGGRDSLAR